MASAGFDFLKELKSRDMPYADFSYPDIQKIKACESFEELSKFIQELGYNIVDASNLSDLTDTVIFADNYRDLSSQKLFGILFIIIAFSSQDILFFLLALFFLYNAFIGTPRQQKSYIKNKDIYNKLEKSRKKFGFL